MNGMSLVKHAEEVVMVPAVRGQILVFNKNNTSGLFICDRCLNLYDKTKDLAWEDPKNSGACVCKQCLKKEQDLQFLFNYYKEQNPEKFVTKEDGTQAEGIASPKENAGFVDVAETVTTEEATTTFTEEVVEEEKTNEQAG